MGKPKEGFSNYPSRLRCAAPTCSESRLVLRKNPRRQPTTTASTDMIRRPFCLQTFFTLSQTASSATAMVARSPGLPLAPPPPSASLRPPCRFRDASDVVPTPQTPNQEAKKSHFPLLQLQVPPRHPAHPPLGCCAALPLSWRSRSRTLNPVPTNPRPP